MWFVAKDQPLDILGRFSLTLYTFIIIQFESDGSGVCAVCTIIILNVLVILSIHNILLELHDSSFILPTIRLGKLAGMIFPLPSLVPI